MMSDYLITAEGAERIRAGVARVREAVETAPKPLARRLRARVGERRPWYDVVEEQSEER